MIQIRRSDARGHFDHGWLNTHHTFSFGEYRDPEHMGFRSLRVINEDRVQSGAGFGEHGHRDMEIISYVLDGELTHRDSLGNGSTLHAGDLQRMSAGTGVRHSEFNGSQEAPVHFYQIWILPERPGIEPNYEELRGAEIVRDGALQLVASPQGGAGVLRLHQDARLYLGNLQAGQQITAALEAGRHAWLQVLRGGVRVGASELNAGDGLAASDESSLVITGSQKETEIMLFDLA